MPIAELSNARSFTIALKVVEETARNPDCLTKSRHVISQRLALALFGFIHHLFRSFSARVSKLFALSDLFIMPAPAGGKSNVPAHRWPSAHDPGLIGLAHRGLPGKSSRTRS
jgi:hypothetical protein